MNYSAVTSHTFKSERETSLRIELRDDRDYGSSSIMINDYGSGHTLRIETTREQIQNLFNQTINNLKLTKSEADKAFVRELLKECQSACSQWSNDELAAAREAEQKRQDELNEGWED